MQFEGANPNADVNGQGMLPGKLNYLIGDDPKPWRTNVPYYRVHYADSGSAAWVGRFGESDGRAAGRTPDSHFRADTGCGPIKTNSGL